MGQKRMPVTRVDHERAESDDEHDDRSLDNHNGRVRVRALSNPVNQDGGDSCDNEQGRQIESDGVSSNDRQRNG